MGGLTPTILCFALDSHQGVVAQKSREPSKQPVSLGIPTRIAARPLGFGATLDLDIY